MEQTHHLIPRKIWILWLQGFNEAPFIVKKCADSWEQHNPSWEVIFLDSGNLGEFIKEDLPKEKLERLSPAHQSDVTRLALLAKYGGIWADATTFCTKPLNDWLQDYCDSGFFAFRNPAPDRLLSNWFIAAEQDSPIVTKMHKMLTEYWSNNDFGPPNSTQRLLIRVLSRVLNKSTKTTKYWFTPVVSKLLKIYPYLIFHYMFERLVSTDVESRTIWHNTRNLSADGPHTIQHQGLFSHPTGAVKLEIDRKSIPLYKLTWRYDHSMYSPDTLLYYLMEQSPVRQT